MSELKGACIIGQSGGPTSVINASAYGVIRTALDSGVVGKSPAQHGGETFSVFAPVIDQLLIQELNRENIVAGHRQPQRLRVGADSAEIM